MVALAAVAAWVTLAQGSSLTQSTDGVFVARTRAQTAAFVSYLRRPEAARVRSVAFTRRSVVAVFTQTPTPCYRVEISGWSRTATKLTVFAELRDPPPDLGCVQAIATAYHVLSVPRLAPAARVVLRVQR